MDVVRGPATAQHSSRRAAQPSRRSQDFSELIVPLSFVESGGRWLSYKDTDSEIDLMMHLGTPDKPVRLDKVATFHAP